MPARFRHLFISAFVVALLLLILVAVRTYANPAADPAAGTPDQAVLITSAAPSSDASPDAAPLAALGPGFLSPVTAAPRPFTHMLLRWEAAQPVSSTLQLELRASLDGELWTNWGPVPENPDLWMGEDGPEVFWSQEIYAGEGARFWQLRATLAPAPDGALPVLRRVEVNTVDARFGPPAPTPDLLAPDAAAALSRPAVVSRSAWGSPDGQGSRVSPKYRSVNHMVVHHTADSNSLTPGQRWPDRVRAIWSFHTITRGWGDIGYNFLIDPDGMVYEGRAGGDDAVAFHDTANYGSMGVAMIGSYTGTPPSAVAQSSLVDVLAWKAGQKDIDPLGRSFYYGCSISDFCSPYNPGSIVSNIAAHRHVTPGHTTCPGDSLEALLPAIRERVRARMAGGSGEPPPPQVQLELLGVSFDRTSVPAGELLKATFTVRNSGAVAVEGQAPEAGRDATSGAYNLADSYVYDEAECFLGAEGQSYPAYPKEAGRLRLMLGPLDAARQPACAGGSGGYPWRWGLNGRLEPGQVREVVAYLRLRTPGTLVLQAGAINEYVGYLAQGSATTTITVTPERQMPAPAAYDELLRPVAHVYQLGTAPNNLLARTKDATAVPRGAYVGSFAWQGETLDWGEGGPLASAPELSDRFIVEQTRAFTAPVSGSYSFQITADDGGWLWVDGRLVAGGAQQGGSVTLEAGRHVLAFKGMERGGGASMGYAVQLPGEQGFGAVRDGLSAADTRLGASFQSLSSLAIAADDMGGVGVAAVRVALNGGEWAETPGAVATVGPLPDGAYTLRYVAVDAAGNQSEERSLSFRVDSNMVIYRTHLPLLGHP